jgi:hypothetical protein
LGAPPNTSIPARGEHARLDQIRWQGGIVIEQMAQAVGRQQARGGLDDAPLAVVEKGLYLETFLHGIGHVPAGGPIRGWHQNGDRYGARNDAGPRRRFGIVPAGRIAIRPDQHRLAGQWGPVGFVDGCLGAVHRSGGGDAHADQGVGALLAFDQDHAVGTRDIGQVVERSGIRGAAHAGAHIPGAELLLTGLRVVAIDTGDQLARSAEVVPLGGVGPECIDGHLRAGGHRRDQGPAHQPGSGLQHRREVAFGIQTQVAGNRGEDIAAFTGRVVVPQPGLVAIERNFQAVARLALDVADQELVAPDLAGRKQCHQHRWQPRQQFAFELIALGVEVHRTACNGRNIVEIKHGSFLQKCSKGWPRRGQQR